MSYSPEYVEQVAAYHHREGCHTSGDMLDAYAATLRQQAARVDDMDAAADRLGDYLVREQSVYLAHKSLRAALEAALSAPQGER